MKYVSYALLLFFLGSCSRSLTSEKEPSLGKRQQNQLSESNFSEGMKEFILGHYPQAQSFFEKSLSLNTDLAASNFMIARIVVSSGKLQDAIPYALKAIKSAPNNKFYYLLAAQIFEQQQNYQDASKIYEKLIADIPDNEIYRYELAANYIAMSKFNDALATYQKLETQFGNSAELTRLKQQLYLKMNKLDQALSEGNNYISENPDDQDFQIVQAEILVSNNKSSEAIVYLEKFSKLYPDNGSGRLLLMNLYKAKGMQDKFTHQLEFILNNPEVDLLSKLQVIEDLSKTTPAPDSRTLLKYTDQLVKSYPSSEEVMIKAGEIYYQAGKKDLALESFTKAKGLEQGNFNLWNRIITLDSELGLTDSMLQHTSQALEVFPNQAVLWLYNGSAHMLKKDPSNAVSAFEQGLGLASGNLELSKEFNMHLGDCYNELKDYEKSDLAFEKVLENDATNEYVLNNYSYYLSLRKQNLEKAKQMSEALVKRFSSNATYLDTYAWVLYVLKDFTNARIYLEKAIANSKNGTIVEHYGDVLFQLGLIDQAVEQWTKAKSLGETSTFINKKIESKLLYE